MTRSPFQKPAGGTEMQYFAPLACTPKIGQSASVCANAGVTGASPRIKSAMRPTFIHRDMSSSYSFGVAFRESSDEAYPHRSCLKRVAAVALCGRLRASSRVQCGSFGRDATVASNIIAPPLPDFKRLGQPLQSKLDIGRIIERDAQAHM